MLSLLSFSINLPYFYIIIINIFLYTYKVLHFFSVNTPNYMWCVFTSYIISFNTLVLWYGIHAN